MFLFFFLNIENIPEKEITKRIDIVCNNFNYMAEFITEHPDS